MPPDGRRIPSVTGSNMPSTRLLADFAWLPNGFVPQASIALDGAPGDSRITAIDANIVDSPGERVGRFVLPGLANIHSHAFQRLMAGLTERRAMPAGSPASSAARDDDSFWTWRETMYAFASRIGPEDLRDIAAQVYVEMLKAGYTQVCEFHYLHNAPDGQPYADPEAMSLALVEAARDAGIGLTLLPVLYRTGGFDGRALSARQRRFGMPIDAFLRLFESLHPMESPLLRLGVALHSLRAVSPDALRAVVDALGGLATPIHIHVAEQLAEVQDCLALRDARPVEWLLDNAPVDRRWCLVHATHMTAAETRRLAASGAVAGLCPTTEANLGDGIFPLGAYLDSGGVFGVGSDSNVSVSPVEELRWLEYGQRLATHHRNVAARSPGGSSGEALWANALRGGTQASGIAAFDPGHGASGGTRPRADLVVLDDTSPLLAERGHGNLLDSFLFAGNTRLVRDVMVAGEWRVRGFRHRDEDAIAARFRRAVARCMALP